MEQPSPAALEAPEVPEGFESIEEAELVQLLGGPFEVYAERLLRVIPKAGGKPQPFVLNKAQRYVHRKLEEQYQSLRMVRALCLKGRQQGLSTLVAGRFFRKVHALPGISTYILSHEDKSTQVLFNHPKRFYSNLPENIRPEIGRSGKDILAFAKTGSQYAVGTAGAKETGRSTTNQLFHGSECAFWANAEDHIAASLQSVPPLPGTEIILESTANGIGGVFHEMWLKAEAGQGEFIAIFVPWFWQEEYSRPAPEAWQPTGEEIEYQQLYDLARDQVYWMHLKNIDLGGTAGVIWWKFKQEYPCLIGSSRIGTSNGIIPIAEAAAGLASEHGQIGKVWQSGVKETVVITTKLGYRVVCTDNHPIALAEGGFVEAGVSLGQTIALQPPRFGDHIQAVSWRPFPGVDSSIRVDEDWARFLGLFMGDGSFHEGTVSVACDSKDEDVVGESARLLRALIGKPNVRTLGEKKGGTEVRVCRREFLDVLRALGAVEQRNSGGWKRKVRVPECIWRSPKHIVREFLRGLFEADGHAGRQANMIAFFGKDEEFVRDVQLLLLGFGVTCRRSRARKLGGVNRQYVYEGNELKLRAGESRRFAKEIGFIGARKQARAAKETRAVGRNALPLQMVDIIATIAPGEVEPVYDLLIPGAHVFGAQGLLVHNCNSEEAFQAGGTEGVIRPMQVMRARKASTERRGPDGEIISPIEVDPMAPRVLGVDIARNVGSGDATHLMDRCGRVAGSLVNQSLYTDNTMAIVGMIIHLDDEFHFDRIFIDLTGVGAGVYDRLLELGWGSRVTGVNFGSGAQNEAKYLNKRAELWWSTREWFDTPGGVSVPDDNVLHRHLCGPQYGFNSANKLVIESKEKIRKRAKFSPDRADALVLTFAERVIKASTSTSLRRLIPRRSRGNAALAR